MHHGPTVFVIQDVPGRDLSDARSYGELVTLLPAKYQASFSADRTYKLLKKTLMEFSDRDYLLLAGDPVAIAIAGALAAAYNSGRMKLLKWDRYETAYFPVEVDLNDD